MRNRLRICLISCTTRRLHGRVDLWMGINLVQTSRVPTHLCQQPGWRHWWCAYFIYTYHKSGRCETMSDKRLKIQKDPRHCWVKKASFRAECSICYCLCKKRVKYKSQYWYWLVTASGNAGRVHKKLTNVLTFYVGREKVKQMGWPRNFSVYPVIFFNF